MFWLLVAVCAVSSHIVAASNAHGSQKIVGGELTTIDRYPFQAALLRSIGSNVFSQFCGGSILNPRSILSAASCAVFDINVQYYRIRVGSTFANSGGVVHSTSQFIMHPNFTRGEHDNDVAVLRSSTVIVFNNFVQPASIAGTNYNLLDNEPVWATGWGATSWGGALSEPLRHVQIWTINQDICRSSYDWISITDNMLCAGVPDVVGNGQCSQDLGGPLHTHNGVVVGITTGLIGCSVSHGLGVNTRVSSFSTWIQANA